MGLADKLTKCCKFEGPEQKSSGPFFFGVDFREEKADIRFVTASRHVDEKKFDKTVDFDSELLILGLRKNERGCYSK